MYLITYENGNYSVSDKQPSLIGAKQSKALIHFEIKTDCPTPYALSEIHSLCGEFVDSCFVKDKWENINFENTVYELNNEQFAVWELLICNDERFSFRNIRFGAALEENLFNGGTLYQLPYIHIQMMGYLYLTPNHQVIAIDGGNPSDKDTVISAIKNLGGKVDHWFITHYHDDHVGAIIESFNSKAITVDNIYFNFPPQDILDLYGDTDSIYAAKLIESIPENTKVITPKKGDVYHLDNLTVTVLNDACFDAGPNFANDTSVCYKFDTGNKKILFPGDLARKCNDYLKDEWFKKEIEDCSIVQMTHHGNNGASKEFYDATNIERCLWPTPLWLWNNDDGHGKNSFKFTTLQTREWMRERNVIKHYLSFDKKILCIK